MVSFINNVNVKAASRETRRLLRCKKDTKELSY